MPDYTKTLAFSDLSDITFQPSASDVKIYVDSELLGAINKNFAVTVFITVSGGSKTITLRQISNLEFTSGNNDDLERDTITFSYTDIRNDLHIEECTGSTQRFKIIGWEDDSIGQICSGSNGCTDLFNITAENDFKCRIQQIDINGKLKWKMVARYGSDVNVEKTSSEALCYSGLFCYYCN